jgi:predicted metallo-beta-lactamase superfamily hydrolase
MNEGELPKMALSIVECPECKKQIRVNHLASEESIRHVSIILQEIMSKHISDEHFLRDSSEGKLKKRINELQYVEDSSIVSSYEMEKLVDEAKKEIYRDMNGGDELALFATIQKWFGE